MHIVFVIPTMDPGGAERVASLLCSYWSSAGHVVDLVTFEGNDTQPFYATDGVQIHRLDAFNSSRNLSSIVRTNALRVIRLRRRLRLLRPDIIVAFLTEANVIAICAGRGLAAGIVVSERNQPNRPGLGPLHKFARYWTYRFADAIVVQTEQIAAWAKHRFHVPVFIMPNPVSLERKRTVGAKPPKKEIQRVVSIGRLTHQKGYDILIKSYSELAGKFPQWRLHIYGEGPERGSLEALIRESGAANSMQLKGNRADISSVLSDANLFVLPSRYEGYPNALLEALAFGLPVIATDCPGGNVEILGNGRYGMVVPSDNIEPLSQALSAMMSQPDLRALYASRARQAVAGLDVDSIGSQWLEVFDRVLERRKAKNRRENSFFSRPSRRWPAD